MVRGGRRYAGVMLDNGRHKLVWRRDNVGKNEKTMYQFDEGTVQTKVGRTQLDEVKVDFNITEVRMANNQKVKVNFWFQGDAPFLINKTSSQLFEFLSLSSCDKYLKVLKAMDVDIHELESRQSSYGITIDTLKGINRAKKSFLDTNIGFEDLYQRIIITDAETLKNNEVEALVSRIQDLQKKLADSQLNLNEVKNKISSIDMAKISKEHKDIVTKSSDLVKQWDMLAKVGLLNDRLSVATRSMSEVDSKISSVDIGKLGSRHTALSVEISRIDKWGDGIDSILRRQALYNASESSLKDLDSKTGNIIFGLDKATISYAYVSALHKQVKNELVVLADMKRKKDRLKSVRQDLQDIKFSIDNVDLESFKDAIRRLNDSKKGHDDIGALIGSIKIINSKISSTQKVLNDTTLSHELVCQEFDMFKQEIGTCPLCGHEL
jgi:hypothetical protein